MNREALDEFFAHAEDVLTDWHGGTDAMHAHVPADGDDDALAPSGDSYYDQDQPDRHRFLSPVELALLTRPREIPQIPEPDVEQIREAMRVIGVAASAWAKQMQEALAALGQFASTVEALRPRLLPVQFQPPVEDARQRALDLRRNRNTGPAARVGLNGTFRR